MCTSGTLPLVGIRAICTSGTTASLSWAAKSLGDLDLCGNRDLWRHRCDYNNKHKQMINTDARTNVTMSVSSTL